MKAYRAFSAIQKHAVRTRAVGVKRRMNGFDAMATSAGVPTLPGQVLSTPLARIPTLYVQTLKGRFIPYADALNSKSAAASFSDFGSMDDSWCVQAGEMWKRFHPGDDANADAMVRRCKSWPFAPNTDANRIVNSLPAGFSADEATARSNSGWTDIVVNNDLAKKAADAAKAEAERLLNAQQESARRAQAARDEAARQAETMRQAQIKAEQDRLKAQLTVVGTVPGTVGTRNTNLNVGIPQLAPPQVYVAPATSNLPLILGGLGVAGVAAFLLLKK